MRFVTTIVIAVLLAMLALPNPGLAQATNTAQLRGTVKDSTNALVPNARVAITSDATGVSESGKTDGQGRYIFNALKPDRYTVRVEAAGFRTTVRSNVELRVGTATGRGRSAACTCCPAICLHSAQQAHAC